MISRCHKAALAAVFLWSAAPLPAQDLLPAQTLTLPQARELARAGLNTQRPDQTITLARGLLEADAKDAEAHYLLARAYAQTGAAARGRRSAARAYRFSRFPQDKFQTAQLAARLAYAENRPMLSQIWLRRTVIHAPSPEVEELVARDYRAVRAANPWYFRLRADLRPSNNVNNGADTALQVIDGVPVTGFLSGAARALSGVIGTLDLYSSYRLHQGPRSATTLSGRYYAQRVELSAEAREQAPLLSRRDFNSTYAEATLRHRFAVGEAGNAALGLSYGTSWYGGARAYDFARLSGERSWRLRGGQTLSVNGLLEDRHNARFGTNDARILELGAQFRQPLGNGDRLDFALALRESDARWFNGSYRSASLRAGYAFGRPVGPMRLSAGLVLGYTDFPIFRSGLFLVPGGRQDQSIYGDVSMLFDQWDYAGFAPLLRLRAGRKSSNDSRYDIREFSVSLGIESKF